MLTRLIYASNVSRPITDWDIKDILESARRKNAAQQLTGMLCYGNNRFLQYLEGERGLINKLYTKLLSDPRHCNLILLEYGIIEERQFHQWSMGFIDLMHKATLAGLAQATSTTEFVPETLTGPRAVDLIQQFKKVVERQIVVEPELLDRSLA